MAIEDDLVVRVMKVEGKLVLNVSPPSVNDPAVVMEALVAGLLSVVKTHPNSRQMVVDYMRDAADRIEKVRE